MYKIHVSTTELYLQLFAFLLCLEHRVAVSLQFLLPLLWPHRAKVTGYRSGREHDGARRMEGQRLAGMLEPPSVSTVPGTYFPLLGYLVDLPHLQIQPWIRNILKNCICTEHVQTFFLSLFPNLYSITTMSIPFILH